MVLRLAIILTWGLPMLAQGVVETAHTAIEQQLDYVKIRIGDETFHLQKGQTLSVLKGDKFLIDSAALVGNRLGINRIDFVGYANSAGARDDSKRWIDSGKDLIPRYSVGGSGDRYSIKVYRLGKVSGEVFIQVVEPSLNYAIVSINGERRMLRASDILSVSATDQFKVEKVVTNFGDDASVSVRIDPLEVRGASVSFKMFEIQFIRKSVVFAKMSMQVRGQ
jgi:hypothetical protein